MGQEAVVHTTRVDQNKWRIASSETFWKVHEENPVAWQGFLRCDPRPGALLSCAAASGASDKVAGRSTSGRLLTLGGGVLSC